MRTRLIFFASMLLLLALVVGIYALVDSRPLGDSGASSAGGRAGVRALSRPVAGGSPAHHGSPLRFYVALSLARATGFSWQPWKAGGVQGAVVIPPARVEATARAAIARLQRDLAAAGLELFVDLRRVGAVDAGLAAWPRGVGILVRHEQAFALATARFEHPPPRVVVQGGRLPPRWRAVGEFLGGPFCFRYPARCWVEGGGARGLHETFAELVTTGAGSVIWHVERAGELEPLVEMLARAGALQRSAAARPMLGVVGGGPLLEEPGVMSLLAAASDLAGYRLAVVDEADPRPAAHVALFSGDDRSAPARIAKLLAREGPLMLAISRLSTSPLWQSTLVAAGLDPRFKGAPLLAGTELRVQHVERSLRWSSGSPPSADVVALEPAQVQGEVVVAADVGKRRVVLAVRQGRVLLVNGVRLHAEARFFLQQLLGGALAQPFDGWGLVGATAAFAARRRAALVANLPLPEGRKLRLTRVGAAGAEPTVEVWSYHAPLRVNLDAGELLLVDPLD